MGTDYLEKMQRYREALEEERRKILVFQRELPLCLELVTQAIGACKQRISASGVAECNDNGNVLSECSEQTSTEGTPIFEEFIPMKRASSSEDDEGDEEEQHSHKQMNMDKEVNASKEMISGADIKKKSDWLKSAQLWNQTPDLPSKEEHQPPRRVSVVEVTGSGGAFQPFGKDQKGSAKSHPSSEKPQTSPPATATSSATGNTTCGKREGKEGQTQTQTQTHTQTQRKQRRCWSPELHRRFLQALKELGGSHAATPKQIRELMKVDGLTNDEVKSHLQKFRLHTRRPSPPIHSSSRSQPQQIVVVEGIWVPPAEYAAMAATEPAAKATVCNRVYAPVAVPPPQAITAPESNSTENHQSEGRGSHSGRSNSSPSSTSSSSHTITASPLY